jgi:hypothetical protein
MSSFLNGGWGTTRPTAIRHRIWDGVEKTETCWLWKGKKTKGYGMLYVGRPGGVRKVAYAHRYIYEMVNGPIPEGLNLDHLCRTPACVRPDHLEAVSQKVNILRGIRTMKTDCPQGHPYSGYNLIVSHRANGRPFRMCRTCKNASHRAMRARAHV